MKVKSRTKCRHFSLASTLMACSSAIAAQPHDLPSNETTLYQAIRLLSAKYADLSFLPNFYLPLNNLASFVNIDGTPGTPGVNPGDSGGNGGTALTTGANTYNNSVDIITGGAGGAGVGDINAPGGNGGTGGGGIIFTANATLSNNTTGSIRGGAGGNAGDSQSAAGGLGGNGADAVLFQLTGGANLTGQSTIIGGNGGNGGGGTTTGSGSMGGDGGTGIVFQQVGSITASVQAQVTGGTGGAGGLSNSSIAAAGGTGGFAVIFQSSGTLTNGDQAIFTGGNGGAGGLTTTGTSGVGGTGGFAVLFNNGVGSVINNGFGAFIGGNGGTGGQSLGVATGGAGGGGASAVLFNTAGSSFTNSATATVTGGNAGAGGASVAGNGGAGGQGGNGLEFTNGGTVLNAGNIQAGQGGAGGLGIITGVAGIGGVGILGANLSIVNTGTIRGGYNGDFSVLGNAIVFNGGTNRLEIQAGSIIDGNVVAVAAGNDTFALGGSTNSTFDLSAIGAAAQYQNFAAFEKTGTSLWELTGTSASVTDWTINGGTLAVNGVVNGTVLVMANTRLQGIGTVGTTTVNGTIAPGNYSMGTLTINGDYTQAPGSFYEVEINPQGQSDLLQISGTANLNGGTVQVIKALGNYQVTRYTILTAATGVIGNFAGLVQNLPFLAMSLAYDNNNVYLDVVQSTVSFRQIGATPNQVDTAGGIESLGTGNILYNIFMNLPTIAAAQAALDDLSGEIHASLQGVLVEENRYLREAVLNRLIDPTSALQLNQHRGFWAQAFGSWSDSEGNWNAAGVTTKNGGIFFGADQDINPDLRLGIVAGYDHTGIGDPHRLSLASTDNYQLGVYGRQHLSRINLRAGGTFGWHAIDTSRQVQIPGLSEHLTAGYNAQSWQLFGEAGFELLQEARGQIEPIAQIAYVQLHADNFQESAGISALSGQSNNTNVPYSTLGGRFTAQVSQSENFIWNGRAVIGWRHAYDDVNPVASFAFSGGSPFVITGTPLARNALMIDAALLADQLQKNLRLTLAYNGEIASHVRDHGIRGVVSWKFN